MEDDSDTDVDITNCDGIVISNLEEKASEDDIKKILNGVALEDEVNVMTIHPTGSMRSKIVKNVNSSKIKMITRKIDQKMHMGRILHCRPHVPVSPPSKHSTPATKKGTEVEVHAVKSVIPGLPMKDFEKAKKKTTGRKKAAKSKLPSVAIVNDERLDGFIFEESQSDTSGSEDEQFEDSVESLENKNQNQKKRTNSFAEFSPISQNTEMKKSK